MAVLCLLSWFKMLMMLRLTKTFGPLFKIIEQMMIELATFMFIMALVYAMFTCVSLVAFGDDPKF